MIFIRISNDGEIFNFFVGRWEMGSLNLIKMHFNKSPMKWNLRHEISFRLFGFLFSFPILRFQLEG